MIGTGSGSRGGVCLARCGRLSGRVCCHTRYTRVVCGCRLRLGVGVRCRSLERWLLCAPCWCVRCGGSWWQGCDSNARSSAYGADEMPLLYPARLLVGWSARMACVVALVSLVLPSCDPVHELPHGGEADHGDTEVFKCRAHCLNLSGGALLASKLMRDTFSTLPAVLSSRSCCFLFAFLGDLDVPLCAVFGGHGAYDVGAVDLAASEANVE